MARRPEFDRTMFGETPEAPKPEKKQAERPREQHPEQIVAPEKNPLHFFKSEMDAIDRELSVLAETKSKRTFAMREGAGFSPKEQKASAETRIAELESRRAGLVSAMQDYAKGNKEPLAARIRESLAGAQERFAQASRQAEASAREIRKKNPDEAEQADVWMGEIMKNEGVLADAQKNGRSDVILRTQRMLDAATENYNDTEVGRAYQQANNLKKKVDDLTTLQGSLE